jgi:hypothetical protein
MFSALAVITAVKTSIPPVTAKGKAILQIAAEGDGQAMISRSVVHRLKKLERRLWTARSAGCVRD